MGTGELGGLSVGPDSPPPLPLKAPSRPPYLRPWGAAVVSPTQWAHWVLWEVHWGVFLFLRLR